MHHPKDRGPLVTAIVCLHCPEVIDSHITTSVTVDLMKKHVKEKHPTKNQFHS